MALLQLKDVMMDLKSLTVAQTKNLALHLGVPFNVLEDIDRNAQFDPDGKKTHFVKQWLEIDKNASWKKIVTELKNLNMIALAETIESEHLQHCEVQFVPRTSASPAPYTTSLQLVTSDSPVVFSAPHMQPITSVQYSAHPTQPATTLSYTVPSTFKMHPVTSASLVPYNVSSMQTVTPTSFEIPPVNKESVAQVKARIEYFEDEFSNLKCDTEKALSLRETNEPEFFDRFHGRIRALPVSMQPVHCFFYKENENDIINARTVIKIFAILDRYCNYFNYDIIFFIIRKYCDAVLKQRMAEYENAFQTFEKATTIDVYLSAITSHPNSEICKEFIKMAVKIKNPPFACTLYEIRQLKQLIAEKAAVSLYSIYTANIATSSVRVELHIHPACVKMVLAAMTTDFMHKHNVSLIGKYIIMFKQDDNNHTIMQNIHPLNVQNSPVLLSFLHNYLGRHQLGTVEL